MNLLAVHLLACAQSDGKAQLRDSRHTMIASAAATTQAMTLAHRGIAKALIVTSQPSATRTNWSTATSENTITATVVKGFNGVSGEGIEVARQFGP